MLILFNIFLVIAAVYLFTKKDLLSYFSGGHLWLTWLAIAVITLMDELTSIFYAPSEAHRFIGLAAIIFIPITSIVIRFLTTRMVQISEILEQHNLKGGGVYNFSYLVLGPFISFVAVASIMIDYVLTAAISTVSAVENTASFLSIAPGVKLAIELIVVWAVAGLNILGIRENAKTTFGIFLVTAVILINLLVAGAMNFGVHNLEVLRNSWDYSMSQMTGHGFSGGYHFFIMSISSCILAYSGIESVLQTARLSETWVNIRKSYVFLALTVGVFTPLLSILVLTSTNIDFAKHETDLITHYASTLWGTPFGVLICGVASFTLIMAVNTACVASSELVERVAHRYGFDWIVKTNSRASLYRVHVATAILFSLIILVTQGQQGMLAEMYAVGLVACFFINLVALFIYNYNKGTKSISTYTVKRFGTVILIVIIGSCFVYLCWHKPMGFALWGIGTAVSLLIGIYGTRKRRPELKEIARGDTPLDLILYVAEREGDNVHIYFKRPQDTPQDKTYDVTAFITLFSPRQKIPNKLKDNHFRIPFKRTNIFNNIQAIMHLVTYELPNKNITVHFGWPTSSWFDRLSTGIMVFQLMKLPLIFPQVNFKMERFRNTKAKKS
jgi:amino acid transporter